MCGARTQALAFLDFALKLGSVAGGPGGAILEIAMRWQDGFQNCLKAGIGIIVLAGFLGLTTASARAQAAQPEPAGEAAPVVPAPDGAPPAAAPGTDIPPAAEPPPDGDASNAQPIEVAARPVALIRGNSSWDEGYKNLTAAFKKIEAEIGKAGLKPAGRRITAFVETDDNGFHYEAMVPIEAAPAGKESLTPEVRLGQSPSGKAMKFQHRGAYDDIDSTYEAITAYLDEKGVEAKNLFVEEYLNEIKSQDDAGTQIDIYVFIK